MENFRLIIFFFFACCVLTLLPFQALAQVDTYVFDPDFTCVDRGNFTANSSFAGNLNRLVSSLSSPTSKPYGFYNLSSGDSSSGEKAHAIGLCRREVRRDDCLSCIQTAARNLTEQCPRSKQAVVVHAVYVSLLEQDNLRKERNRPNLSLRAGETVSSNRDEFERLQRAAEQAQRRCCVWWGNRKYAQGNSTASPGYRRFYGSAQCTPDLSEEDLWSCPSCNFRFETWRFYELDADLEADPPGSAGSPTPAVTTLKTGKSKGGSKVVIAIVIPIVLVALFAICLLGLEVEEEQV
ncbi:hypothetical protein Bca52824_088696 [Brassica carinata]|uniref:Gnk2-homologous domain-containing protein n=1 Tax=Brassica carinata TaxID=52824 RepID=A0A8X7PEH3_BRACI|nr:hypothetical protein Bca52824_088696 [Brassica carinata]